MKKALILTSAVLLAVACSSHQEKDKKTVGKMPTETKPVLEEVASFNGVQVTGVTSTKDGRMFANFPRWRSDIPYSVVEVMPDGSARPYPNEKWNSYQGAPEKNKFTCVQSVVAHNDSLFVLDPSSPMMEGVVGRAKLYEFNLADNTLKKTWSFDSKVAPKKSYLNDLRIDDANQKIYITDSGRGGIVVLDLKTGKSWRTLDDDKSTKAENVILTVDRKKFLMRGTVPKIHSDGIAFSPEENKLYYHALTGYHLYSVPTEALNEKGRTMASEKVEDLGITGAPDGMIFDKKGNLYMADLERNAVMYRTPAGEMKTLIQDERLKWPDTFTIDNENNLIFTDSRLQAAVPGASVDGMEFKIYKVALPQ